MKCEIKYCKSGLDASVLVTENVEDASFSVGICKRCAKCLGLQDGGELKTDPSIHERLKNEYSKST